MNENCDSVPVAASGVAYRLYEQRVVIVHPQDNRLLTLNTTASALWSAMDGAATVAEIVHAVLAKFEVGPEQLLADAQNFFADMERRGLVACL